MSEPSDETKPSEEEVKKKTQIDKQKRAEEDQKHAISYLKRRVEELERSMAKNYVKGYFALAAQDAKMLAVTMEVLGDIDQRK